MREFTDEEDRKIWKAFEQDANFKEAAIETGIDYMEILEWASMGDRMQQIEIRRLKPKWEAKKLVAKEASISIKDAQWYLDRKAKDEFSTRTELTGENGKDLIPKPLLYNVRGDNSTSEGDEVKKED